MSILSIVVLFCLANQKGKSRHFSTPEEIQSQMAKIDLQDDEEGTASKENESGSGSDESGSEDEDYGKPKGVSGLIQIENPNRIVKKPNCKLINYLFMAEIFFSLSRLMTTLY